MGLISGYFKYKAFKKGVETVKDVFRSKTKSSSKRTASAKRKPALRKTARA